MNQPKYLVVGFDRGEVGIDISEIAFYDIDLRKGVLKILFKSGSEQTLLTTHNTSVALMECFRKTWANEKSDESVIIPAT